MRSRRLWGSQGAKAMELPGPDVGDEFDTWLQNLELAASPLRPQKCVQPTWCPEAPTLNQAECSKVHDHCYGCETQGSAEQSAPAQQLDAKPTQAVTPPCEARASLAASGYDSEATQDDSDLIASQPRVAAAGKHAPRTCSLQSPEAQQVRGITAHAMRA
jgi:hypothetical protein